MTKYEMRNGDYVLVCQNTKNIVLSTHEIAVLFTVDQDTVVFHKHGNPQNVSEYMSQAVKKLRDAGFHEMADSYKMYSGKFPVEAINRLLDTSGYAAKFVREIESGKMLPVDLDIAL
ncbi:hypothetical protein [Vibrio owensii]|uniref:hypothetical protein n=1 Tax=Vibrio harveyi group TaxID=717610 RepID=UPI003CC5B445